MSCLSLSILEAKPSCEDPWWFLTYHFSEKACNLIADQGQKAKKYFIMWCGGGGANSYALLIEIN